MQVKCYIHAQWSKYAKQFNYLVYNCDMTDYGYTLLECRELEFESPTDKKLQELTVKTLRQKQQALRAKIQAEVNFIEDEITELLALEYIPSGEPTKVDDDLPF